MTRKELIGFLEKKGWTKDAYGNFHPPEAPKKVRIKLNPRVARLEQKDPLGKWRRVRSATYKALHLNAEGKLSGWKR